MEDLEGLAGIRRTKGGSNDTEPAYVVARTSFCRMLALGSLFILAAFGLVWRSDSMLRKLAPKLAARRAAARHAEHSAHSRFTRLGQEFEQHLEMDMKEREQALKLRAKLRSLEKVHRTNVTRALDTAAIATEAFTFEARDALAPYLDSAVESLFEEVRLMLEARIVSPMLSTGAVAVDRHHALHEEILSELRKDAAERDSFLRKQHNARGDPDGDGIPELDREYGDARGDDAAEHEDPWANEGWDEAAAAKRDEEWRAEMIEHFKESFERHFNDTAMSEDGQPPRALLLPDSPLFEELSKIADKLGYSANLDPSANDSSPVLTWRDAEAKLASLAPELLAQRCPAFEASAPPDDDEYDYMQLHNVEHYLSELKWQAKLNGKRDLVQTAVAEHAQHHLTTMELVEKLESLEGDQTFPSFWLYHSPGGGDDYRYGDW